MKISRNKVVKASCEEEKDQKVESSFDDAECVTDEEVLATTHAEANKCIMSAIDILSKTAGSDQQSKDAIANLSVVYFDLQ